MLSKLCGGPDSPERLAPIASPTGQVYQLYDDYFSAVDLQPTWQTRKPAPPPAPIAWPEPVVLPKEVMSVVDRTYVPLTQKMPELRERGSHPPPLRDSFLQQLDRLQEGWLGRIPDRFKLPPTPPTRSSSLPKAPTTLLPVKGEPIPAPVKPNPRRPLPVPPRPPLPPPPGPPPTIPLPEPPTGVLPAQDRTHLSPNDLRGFVQATSQLRPLKLPQMVADRQKEQRRPMAPVGPSGLRPLVLPRTQRLPVHIRLADVTRSLAVPEDIPLRPLRLNRSSEVLVETTDLPYLQDSSEASAAAAPHAAPEVAQKQPDAGRAADVGLAC